MKLPTLKQYLDYRARKRDSMWSLVGALRAGTCSRTTWFDETVTRLRREHSDSIRRQREHGTCDSH